VYEITAGVMCRTQVGAVLFAVVTAINNSNTQHMLERSRWTMTYATCNSWCHAPHPTQVGAVLFAVVQHMHGATAAVSLRKRTL
jgi:hypothetical protein